MVPCGVRCARTCQPEACALSSCSCGGVGEMDPHCSRQRWGGLQRPAAWGVGPWASHVPFPGLDFHVCKTVVSIAA